MKLITSQSLANSAAARFKAHHYTRGQWNNWFVPGKAQPSDIHHQLELLGEFPSPASVDRVIGNRSWTTPPGCSECGQTYSVVVEVGQAPDYDSDIAYLCEKCCEKALSLLQPKGDEA